jgi:septal ring factor EnvC (AmiA/AmiB activator)
MYLQSAGSRLTKEKEIDANIKNMETLQRKMDKLRSEGEKLYNQIMNAEQRAAAQQQTWMLQDMKTAANWAGEVATGLREEIEALKKTHAELTDEDEKAANEAVRAHLTTQLTGAEDASKMAGEELKRVTNEIEEQKEEMAF